MTRRATCETCRDLLNEALNLACRSDQFEEQRRRQAALEASSCAEEWLESGRFDAYVGRYYTLHTQRKIWFLTTGVSATVM